MKLAELKKKLNGSKVTIDFKTSYDSYVNAEIRVSDSRDNIITIKAQANKLNNENKVEKQKEGYLPYYGSFYAIECDCTISMKFNYRDDSETINNFFKLVSKRITEKNYEYVYDCQLSQLLECLRDFKAYTDIQEVDYTTKREWIAKQRKLEREKDEKLNEILNYSPPVVHQECNNGIAFDNNLTV